MEDTMSSHKDFLATSVFFFLLFFTLNVSEGSPCESLFLIKPGEGEAMIYAPVGHNTTLTCSVNSSILVWEVNDFRFGDSATLLHGREIFQSEDLVMNTSHILSSTLSVFGSDTNHEANICCRSRISVDTSSFKKCCTVLFVYYPPVQPVVKTPQYIKKNGSVKLSWNANLTEGISHNYTIIIHNVTATTLESVVYKTVIVPYYLLDVCGEFDVEVKAVNIAGESEPSATVRVSLPLLPDFLPVSDSLETEVWKSSGQILVQIHFEPAYFCARQAIAKYCVWLRSILPKGNSLSFCVNSNDTDILLGLDDGVEDNNFYEYSITAVNDFGNSTSVTKNISTFDVERVNVEKHLSNSIDIECYFINGSDARGCKVVLVSEHPSVENITTVLLRSNESDTIATSQLNLIYHIDCHHYVLAFDIEADGTVSSSSAIRQKIELNVISSQCFITVTGRVSFLVISVTTAVGIPVIILMVLCSSLVYLYRVKVNRPKPMEEHCDCAKYIQTIPNEVYGAITDRFETTPNEVYVVSTDSIDTTPNEVHGVSTDGIESTPK